MKKIIKIGLGLSLLGTTLSSLYAAGKHTFFNATQASAAKGGKLEVTLDFWSASIQRTNRKGFELKPGEEKTLSPDNRYEVYEWSRGRYRYDRTEYATDWCLKNIAVLNRVTQKRGGGKVSFCGNSKTTIGMDSLGMMITTYSVPQP